MKQTITINIYPELLKVKNLKTEAEIAKYIEGLLFIDAAKAVDDFVSEMS